MNCGRGVKLKFATRSDVKKLGDPKWLEISQSNIKLEYVSNSVVAYGNDRYLLAQSTKFGTCIA